MRWHGKQLEIARLKADMSRGDLAYRMREVSGGAVKPTERSIRGWERDENEPVGTAAAVAAKALEVSIEIFYVDGDEQEAALSGDPFHGSDGEAAPGDRVKRRRGAGKEGRVEAA